MNTTDVTCNSGSGPAEFRTLPTDCPERPSGEHWPATFVELGSGKQRHTIYVQCRCGAVGTLDLDTMLDTMGEHVDWDE